MSAKLFTALPMDAIGFKPPYKNKLGNTALYVQERGQWGGPRVQLCDPDIPQTCPFGINVNDHGNKSFSINVSDPTLTQWCADVDKVVLAAAKANAKAWFGKELDDETLGVMYKTMLGPPKEGYDPLLRLKLAEWGNEKDTKVWLWQGKDEDGKDKKPIRGTLEDITRMCTLVPIVTLNSLYFVQNTFGMSLLCTDVMIMASRQGNPNLVDFVLPFTPVVVDEGVTVAAPPTMVSYETFDRAALVYQPPTKNPHGGITVWLRHPNRRFQFPECEVPFGINVSEEEPTRKTFAIAVTDPGLEAWCLEQDACNLQHAVVQSEAWFAKKLAKGVVENFYKPLVNVPEKETHSKLLRLKITPDTQFWRLEGETVHRAEESDLKGRCRLIPVVEPSSLWFIGNSFGMSFKAMHILITAPGSEGGGAAATEGGDFIFGAAADMDQSQ
jgi:hypothetical protein